MRNPFATSRDMILSLAVLLVPCLLIYWWFSRVPDAPDVPVAKWQPVVAQARTEARFPVLAPRGLPDTWKPVKAKWDGEQLQLGFLSPDTEYFEERQAGGAGNAPMVNQVSRSGRADGTMTVSGREWEKLISDDGRTRCLVNRVKTGKPLTTVVCGDTEYEGVAAFVSTLA